MRIRDQIAARIARVIVDVSLLTTRTSGGIVNSTTRKNLLRLGIIVATVTIAAEAPAFEEFIPGKLFVAKPGGKLVKFIGKAPKAGPLFELPSSNPNVAGATLRVFDSSGAGGGDTYTLNPGQWKELGNPPGSKGYKYQGSGTAADPCKVVLIKEKIVKAVCKDKGGGGVLLATPFFGTAGVVLGINGDRYCGEWGGITKKNDDTLIKRKDSPPPLSCPSFCGNNIQEGAEACDGTDDAACESNCQSDCTCLPSCGNNIREGTEECDGTDDGFCPSDCLGDCTCATCPDTGGTATACTNYDSNPQCSNCCDFVYSCYLICGTASIALYCSDDSYNNLCTTEVFLAGCAAECCP